MKFSRRKISSYPYIAGAGLPILSQTSGNTYVTKAGGRCGCKARRWARVIPFFQFPEEEIR